METDIKNGYLLLASKGIFYTRVLKERIRIS